MRRSEFAAVIAMAGVLLTAGACASRSEQAAAPAEPAAHGGAGAAQNTTPAAAGGASAGAASGSGQAAAVTVTPSPDRPAARVGTPDLLKADGGGASGAGGAGAAAEVPLDARAVVRTARSGTGVVVEDLKLGEGQPCLPGANVTMHVRGWAEGSKAPFDDSRVKREPQGAFPGHDGSPLKASLRDLRPGMRDGLVGMQAGGVRRLRIPAGQAFGFVGLKDREGNVLVPPDTGVIYEIELISIDQRLLIPGAGNPGAAPAGQTSSGQTSSNQTK